VVPHAAEARGTITKLKLVITLAVAGVALTLPNASSAAPRAPTFQDSVSLAEAPAVFTDAITVEELNATSGPNGEDPSGQLTFNLFQQIFDSGPVTCLAVSGNTAILNFRSSFLGGAVVTLELVDDSPDTFSVLAVGRAAGDCSPSVPTSTSSLISGDIKVVDTQPPPTSKAQCLNGGWKQFGFTNQGLCIAFVERGP
jgi:hypothetical protein